MHSKENAVQVKMLFNQVREGRDQARQTLHCTSAQLVLHSAQEERDRTCGTAPVMKIVRRA